MGQTHKGAGNMVIVIVDDDGSFRNSIRRLVQSFGYGTMAFKPARQFLASRSSCSCACVILDVHMPHIDGFQVAEQVLLRNCKLPIILQSGNVTESDIQRAQALRVLLLQKPVHPEKLQNTLKRLCRHIRKKKEPRPRRALPIRPARRRRVRVVGE